VLGVHTVIVLGVHTVIVLGVHTVIVLGVHTVIVLGVHTVIHLEGPFFKGQCYGECFPCCHMQHLQFHSHFLKLIEKSFLQELYIMGVGLWWTMNVMLP